LSLIGLIVYLLVRQLERRLRGLEAAATRIAKGSLETRVPARGADSVGRLASAFNGMAEHLQQLLAIQRELVRAVSHELRTPVARSAFRPGDDRLGHHPASLEKYCEGMDHDIEDLDKLVDEMLTYARLEQGSPALNVSAHRPRCAGQSGDRRAGAAARRGHGAARAVSVGGRLRRRLGRGRAALPASGVAEPGEQRHAPRARR
jgi:signal transduction histidine kinase